jgi:hypothetical protein
MKLATIIVVTSCLFACRQVTRHPQDMVASPIPAYSRDPEAPRENEIWYNSFEDKIKVRKHGRILNYTP